MNNYILITCSEKFPNIQHIERKSKGQVVCPTTKCLPDKEILDLIDSSK